MSDTETVPTGPPHDAAQRRVDVLKITVSLCLTYTLCIAFLRVWIRRNIFGIDDYVALVATILALGQYAAEYVSIGNGLGKTIEALHADPNLLVLNKAELGSVILWVLSLYASKCAAVVFMSRFASPGRHKKEITAVLAIVVALGLGSMLALMVDCRVVSSIYYWDFPGHESFCPSPYTRWQVVVAFDVITEILILVVPVDLIWCLQMPSSRKVGIIVSFYIRIPVLAFSIARDYYVHNLMSASDTGLASRYVIIWQEVELTYSIAAATLMCLRPLIRDFDTGFGLGGETVRTHAASGYILSNGENSRTGGKLSKYGKGSIIQLSSRGKDKDNFSVTEAEVPRTRPKHESTTEVTASHDPQDHGGRGSTGRGADDILITHRVEQSVYPRNMV